MTDTPTPTYRSRHRASGEAVELRESEELEDGDDGMMEIRLPIASTGDVRNEDDDPLTRSELEGMARQISERQIGVFPAHGADSTIANGHYSPFERLGDWADAAFQERSKDGEEGVLIATARMPDPEDMTPVAGDYREGLAILKEQAKRGIAQDASIGWRDDEDFPGGVDLMEASIVGIGADWRTNTGDESAKVVARAAVDAGADPDELVNRVRSAVATDRNDTAPDEGRPLGPPGDRDRFESFEECVTTLSEDDDLTEDDAERICGAWEQASKGESESDSEQSTDDMTDDPDPSDDEGTDTEAQDASDVEDETTERAPADIGEDDICEFLGEVYDGVEPSDIKDLMAEAGAEFSGLSEDTAAWFIGDILDVPASEVGDMMDGGNDEQGGDMDDDEEDDEDEMSADSPESEQAADTEESDLAERVAELEDALESVRSGETEVDTPEPNTDDEQAADTDDSETTDRAAAGPNWRS